MWTAAQAFQMERRRADGPLAARAVGPTWFELRRAARCGRLPAMVPEAQLEQTEDGLVPQRDGGFVLNAREARWRHGQGRGAICDLEGEPEFPQLGIHLFVLGPAEPMSMYHWEADQEDFLVLAGEALLIVEGEERPLRQW